MADGIEWLLWQDDKDDLVDRLKRAIRHYKRTRREVPNVVQVRKQEIGDGVQIAGVEIEAVTNLPEMHYRVGRRNDSETD